MPMALTTKHLVETAASLRRHKLAAMGLVALALALVPFALYGLGHPISSASTQSSASSSSKTAMSAHMTMGKPDMSAWAGQLESARRAAKSAANLPAATSASYTSGFNKKSVDPLPPVAQANQPHNPRACPTDLNCAFRSGKRTASLRHRPKRVMARLGQDHSMHWGLDLLPVHLSLPSPNNLLKPFTFVSDKVVGFVKKL